MATAEVVQTEQVTDTAIGAVKIQTSLVVGYDIDDFVASTVKSIAVSIQMFNKINDVDTEFTKDRRIASIGGVTVGGY